jgi:hypothetical protein
VDTWRAAYRGIVPDDYLANLSYEESGRRWLDRLTTDGRGVFVADNDRSIFGSSPQGAPGKSSRRD